MKANAITRIVIYSIVILLLIGLLLTFLGIGTLTFDLGTSGDYTAGAGAKQASSVHSLKIDWAAGFVRVIAGDTDRILFSEKGSTSEDQKMVHSLTNGTLYIRYSKPSVQIGLISYPQKELTITVPRDWYCENITINAAAVTVDIEGVSVSSIDLDGASNELNFQGSFHELDCDGAANRITASCTNVPNEISLDGAYIDLDLKLPKNAAFQVAMDGLSSNFSSDFETTFSDGSYTHGSGGCKIDADGVSTKISIRKGA